ncbi:Hypothetical_protein [Hexamita inflata]|uniref:Hypothetical_protein n=1 Tax=Hexamita inflata TaxID=28002 RepID=A0ABP1HA66_9EUKA
MKIQRFTLIRFQKQCDYIHQIKAQHLKAIGNELQCVNMPAKSSTSTPNVIQHHELQANPITIFIVQKYLAQIFFLFLYIHIYIEHKDRTRILVEVYSKLLLLYFIIFQQRSVECCAVNGTERTVLCGHIPQTYTSTLSGQQNMSYWILCNLGQEGSASAHLLQFRMGDWSSGMIPALGAGGRGFNSRISSIFKKLQWLQLGAACCPSH